ncbi:hypothetical protein CCZ01_09610, partial [Helicobacter monodelphidis]|uniref:DUF4214 domain-containing protein n=1 Tax=Helicobacter sp. 15-1451 TaxID=2004995 RepID=UPI000DCC22D1
MAITASQVYVALFNRAIDGQTRSSFNGIAGTLASAEAASIKNLSEKDFVILIYKNALGKSLADDTEGINFWAQYAVDNKLSKDQLLTAIFSEIERKEQTGELTANENMALQVFKTKTQVSDYAAETIKGQVPADDLAKLTFGVGLEAVTGDNAGQILEAIKEQVNGVAVKYPVSNPGETFSLTAGTTAYTGTERDDTFNAVVSADSGSSTL